MAVAPMLSVLLLAVIARSKCDSSNGYHYNSRNGAASFGELLKPPPLPLSQIQPVPFHGGASRSQRYNADTGYNYQPPPPPPPPPVIPSSEFKFPAPFYKQYNFNFVPPPQPFTTPSSSLFQKVSSWLFPSQETGSAGSGYDAGSAFNNNNIAPVKKDCNPCNQVPWIPVIRYNLGAKNVQQSLIPTYGPPSPTAQNAVQFRPRPFYSQNQELPQTSGGVPHANYGPPPSPNGGFPSSTYGPPSPTHTAVFPSSSTFVPSSSFPVQSSSYGSSSTSLGQISSTYNLPSSSYGGSSSTFGEPSSSYGVPSSTYGSPSSSYGLPSSSYGVPSSTYGTPTSTYKTPGYEPPRPLTSNYLPATPNYEPGDLNNDLPQDNQVEIINNQQPADEMQLPKVSAPFGFRNSYGEPISNIYAGNVPFPVSATAAESTKIRAEVLPLDSTKGLQANGSLALSKPAPFTLNRGRNIHTLQPVALPNLSVSPLPPIFNARPFRPLHALNFALNHAQGNNQNNKQTESNVNIEQSVPLAEFTHSVDYPTSYVQSPLIDIDVAKVSNQSKAYRNIPNGFIVDSIRDISSQASEDHLSATKSNQDSSFESTGADVGNDLYESGIPADLRQNSGNQLSNHNKNFADLRGVKDEDVDKYRTESNLQHIDSPLLYLKPGAPHKEYTNFVISTISPPNNNDYEIYDDISTTTSPKQSSFASAWDESRTDYSDAFSQPSAGQEDANKPKIVQIIIPYTTGQQNEQNGESEQSPEDWISTPEDDYQARKVPTNTENNYNLDSGTDTYTTVSTTTEDPTNTEHYNTVKLNTPAILNDLYDVKEPSFDIIKLQHNIDDWTEQEFSKRFKTPQLQRSRTNEKYAKQIPDEYFTTNSPVTNYLTPSTINYDFYDHEGSSSIRHAVTDKENSDSNRGYNSIERTKKKIKDQANDDSEDSQKLHIYTAASSFRSTTTTPAPWGKIQTSISPLTKEKVYVVTSKPWTEIQNVPNDWEDVESFESKKTNLDNDVSASDSLPFQSPRFSNRPRFPTEQKTDSVKEDSSYGFSRNWHQRINDLENWKQNNSTSLPEGSQQKSTNEEEHTHPTTVTAEPPEDVSSAN